MQFHECLECDILLHVHKLHPLAYTLSCTYPYYFTIHNFPSLSCSFDAFAHFISMSLCSCIRCEHEIYTRRSLRQRRQRQQHSRYTRAEIRLSRMIREYGAAKGNTRMLMRPSNIPRINKTIWFCSRKSFSFPIHFSTPPRIAEQYVFVRSNRICSGELSLLSREQMSSGHTSSPSLALSDGKFSRSERSFSLSAPADGARSLLRIFRSRGIADICQNRQ